jgi:hypothetical protein
VAAQEVAVDYPDRSLLSLLRHREGTSTHTRERAAPSVTGDRVAIFRVAVQAGEKAVQGWPRYSWLAWWSPVRSDEVARPERSLRGRHETTTEAAQNNINGLARKLLEEWSCLNSSRVVTVEPGDEDIAD